MKYRWWLTAFLLACLTVPSLNAQEFRGKVVGVTDGDTITVLHNSTPIKVRLNGIDAPEAGQPFGERAKQFASALCFGDEVTVKTFGIDKYGRTLGDVVLGDGRILNQELVKAGMAWHYKEYSKDAALAKLEQEAREKKVGLWSDPHAVSPWDWRHGTAATESSSTTSVKGESGQSAKAKPASQIVYITSSGKKYHADGCRYLSKSKIAIELSDAIARGYGPCSACNPPTGDSATTVQQPTTAVKTTSAATPSNDVGEQTVYVTRTGSKYHRAGCRYLSKSAIPMKLKDAATRYSPCGACNPPRLNK
jgi:micrococcal nuclease